MEGLPHVKLYIKLPLELLSLVSSSVSFGKNISKSTGSSFFIKDKSIMKKKLIKISAEITKTKQ